MASPARLASRRQLTHLHPRLRHTHGRGQLMAIIRLPHRLAAPLLQHLDEHPERFAFCFADWSVTSAGPAFRVREVRVISDEAVVPAPGGYELHPDVLVDVVNHAVRTKTALIESHSHGGRLPRFSPTDRRGLADVVPSVL